MTKKKVCIIGLGYVGLPMTIALANVKRGNKFLYEVFGYDHNIKKANKILTCIKNKTLPFDSLDKELKKKFISSSNNNKIKIVQNINQLAKMETIILSVGFDFINNSNSFKNIKELIKKISEIIKSKALLIIETTLPPGTFEKVLIPEIKKILKKRKITIKNINLGYSYERIMPGKDYYSSIINNYRCYSGFNNSSKRKVKNFLKSFINYKKYPLRELNTITECETAKILENSYRATNIALIDEWVNYADLLKVDLLKIINAIKLRPSHSNIMRPGLGVGGYCLRKDALFAKKSAKLIFKSKINFPFINLAAKINNLMPNTSFRLIKDKVKNLSFKKVLIVGTSYKEDIDDERNSPSISIIKKLKNKVSIIKTYDPMIDKINVPDFRNFDLVVLCVKHNKIQRIPLKHYSKRPIYFDLNNVLEDKKIKFMKKNNFKLFILGRYYE